MCLVETKFKCFKNACVYWATYYYVQHINAAPICLHMCCAVLLLLFVSVYICSWIWMCVLVVRASECPSSSKFHFRSPECAYIVKYLNKKNCLHLFFCFVPLNFNLDDFLAFVINWVNFAFAIFFLNIVGSFVEERKVWCRRIRDFCCCCIFEYYYCVH